MVVDVSSRRFTKLVAMVHSLRRDLESPLLNLIFVTVLGLKI